MGTKVKHICISDAILEENEELEIKEESENTIKECYTTDQTFNNEKIKYVEENLKSEFRKQKEIIELQLDQRSRGSESPMHMMLTENQISIEGNVEEEKNMKNDKRVNLFDKITITNKYPYEEKENITVVDISEIINPVDYNSYDKLAGVIGNCIKEYDEENNENT